MVGYLVNPLTLPVARRREDSLASLAHRLAPTVVTALEHQTLPFPWLVERLAPPRGDHHPLFQVALAYESCLLYTSDAADEN